MFGEERLAQLVLREIAEDRSAAETMRRLSHRLLEARSGQTSDDATVLMLEWRGN
jgi:hypothetical protein